MTELVERHTILAVMVGSRAYGLAGPAVTAWAETLLRDLSAAADETALLDTPDRAKIDQLLVGVRERGLL
jgi:hypothetical protein